MIKEAIRTSILTDAEVVAQLARHEFTTGVATSPAIFTTDTLPLIAGRPCIQIVDGASRLSTSRGENGMGVLVTVLVWGNKVKTSKPLSDLAVALWRHLCRARLAITGYQFAGADVFYPVPTDDVDGFPGYGITIDVTFMTQGGW